MTETEPTSAHLLLSEATTPLPWDLARTRLAEASTFWLATVRPEGSPHARPVLAVVADGRVFTSTGPGARKAENLRREPRCSLTASTDGLDVVVEGVAQLVDDEAVLAGVAAGYHEKYDWPVTVSGGAFDGAEGAPTAGPPPYVVYELRPSRVYGFGTDDAHAPRATRWTFDQERS